MPAGTEYRCRAQLRLPHGRLALEAVPAMVYLGNWKTGRSRVCSDIATIGPDLNGDLELSLTITGIRALSATGALILAAATIRDDLALNGVLAKDCEPSAIHLEIEERPGA